MKDKAYKKYRRHVAQVGEEGIVTSGAAIIFTPSRKRPTRDLKAERDLDVTSTGRAMHRFGLQITRRKTKKKTQVSGQTKPGKF